MKTQHTPGPYSISGIPGDHHIMARSRRVNGAEKITLAIVTGHPSLNDGEFYANQRLFRAAPDLLEACRAVKAAFKNCTPYEMEQNGYDGAEEALDKIDAAIAATEGDK